MSQGASLHQINVTELKGIGPKGAERLQRLGITTVQDVLFHLPLKYQDRSRIVVMANAIVGQQITIEGEIQSNEIRFGRRRSLLVHLSDGSAYFVLRFFHFSAAQKNNLIKGVRLRCFGEVRKSQRQYEMVHPEYEVVKEALVVEQEAFLTPVYPTTDGMHQLTWRSLIDQCLALLDQSGAKLEELLPDKLLKQNHFPHLIAALQFLHRPPADSDVQALLGGDHPAQQRLIFEELLSHQISLRLMRYQHEKKIARKMQAHGDLTDRLLHQLPFSLTAAQQRTVDEIKADLCRPHPMMRLVQGDVGSGKTIVAALAILTVIDSGYQVAMMAPTELLAEQHYQTFCQWLEPLGVSVGWLTGKQKGKLRRQLLSDILSEQHQLIVGTHALFQEDVVYGALGLVVIDEQHRFGVHQRLALTQKTKNGVPHQLVMTATPIPRTLAMTAFADLDVSIIDELPPGRTPVTTVVIADTKRPVVIERVKEACQSGRQAYWVCTLIEESESLQCQAAENTALELTEVLVGLKVGLVHGRLTTQEKQKTMLLFKQGEIDLLVATTVIEVGVDVPNASLMIIENPERLGLSQLHQLRGRVGRGCQVSHCLLMYHPPLSKNAQQRLAVMRETNDGFVVAQKDLELRGPGEVLGTRQTGEMQLRIADILRDQAYLPAAQKAAERMIEAYPVQARLLVERWIGHKVNYGGV